MDSAVKIYGQIKRAKSKLLLIKLTLVRCFETWPLPQPKSKATGKNLQQMHSIWSDDLQST